MYSILELISFFPRGPVWAYIYMHWSVLMYSTYIDIFMYRALPCPMIYDVIYLWWFILCQIFPDQPRKLSGLSPGKLSGLRKVNFLVSAQKTSWSLCCKFSGLSLGNFLVSAQENFLISTQETFWSQHRKLSDINPGNFLVSAQDLSGLSSGKVLVSAEKDGAHPSL